MAEKKKNEISTVDAEVVTPMDLLVQAQKEGANVEMMERLFALKVQHDEHEAKKAYHQAVADFKTESITILKTKKVGYANRDGTFTGYSHATLGGIVNTITPILSKHGLSHSWDISQEGPSVTVTCRLSHAQGHSSTVSMSAGKDDSGKKNLIQQVASTVTYLQRYTLLSVTGLAASDQDDDGCGSGDDTEYITENQVMDLEALAEQAKVNMQGFLVWLKVDDLAKVPVDRFDAAVEKLEQKIKESN